MSLRRNTVYGALGFAVPTVVVFFAYPAVLGRLGPAAMGVYILALSLSGSFAFLEFGLTTVTTKLVAEASAGRDPRRGVDAVATSLAFYLVLGTAGALALNLIAPMLAGWAGAPDRARATLVFRIAAALLVSSYLNSVMVSVVKGLQRFDYATAQSSALSALSWGGAVAALSLGGNEVHAILATLLANVVMVVVSSIVTLSLCARHGLRLPTGRPRLTTLRSMFRFGVFMSLNGLAGVLMNQVQNFAMARLLTSSAVAVWGTAVQVVSKINGLTTAAFEFLLPVSADLAHRASQDEGHLRTLRSVYLKALALALALSAGASIALYAAAPPLVRWWLHSPIDTPVATVLRILCVGLAVNGATPVPYHLLNGLGRPQVNTAFMFLGTAVILAVLIPLAWHGVSVERFAIATSVSMVVSGLAFFVYCELRVWRRPREAARDVARTVRRAM